MALNGKYELVNLSEFAEYLKKRGLPEEHAKALQQTPMKLEIKIEGDRVTLNLDTVVKKTAEYIFGKEIEEEYYDKKIKSTATLSGDILTIVMSDDNNSKRVFEPTASGMVETITTSKGGCKLEYKKL